MRYQKLLSLAISCFTILTAAAVSQIEIIDFHTSKTCNQSYAIEFICLENQELKILKGDCLSKDQWYKKAQNYCQSQATLDTQAPQTQTTNLLNISPNLNFANFQIPQNTPKSPRLLIQKSNLNSVNHADHTSKSTNFLKGPFREFTGPLNGEPGNSNFECNWNDVSDLNTSNLIPYLEQQSYDCLRFLFENHPSVLTFFTPNNLELVISHLQDFQITPLNQSNLPGLLRYLRAAFYNEFYASLDFSETLKDQAHMAILSIFNQIDFQSSSLASDLILNEITATILPNYSYLFVDIYTQILNSFNSHPLQWNSYERQIVIYSILYSIDYSIGIYDDLGRQYYQSQDFIDNLSLDLILELENLAANTQLAQSEGSFLVDNAIWILGHLMVFPENPHSAQILEFLTAQLSNHQYLSSAYLWIVSALDHYNDCQTFEPELQICRSDLTQQIQEQILPNQFVFDDGSLIFQTALELEDLNPLYQAYKEVQSQFDRITQTLRPLSNDPNSTLKVVIYGSRADYETYQTFLNNLDTNNGGIYIEQTGTFYTYQRTSRESIYSLQELFRHEYVHFLVGRFLIDGMWGQADIYSQNALTWFDEGFAEFLAGANQNSIQPRRSLAFNLPADPNSRMRLEEIFAANYSSFDFYTYAGLFFNFLYQDHLQILQDILSLVRVGDLDSYNQYLVQLRQDQNLQDQYQAFLEEQYQNRFNLESPNSQVVDFQAISTNDINLVQTFFRQSNLGRYANCSISNFNIYSRYTCTGRITGSLAQSSDLIQAWHNFNQQLNSLQNFLQEANNLNNFQSQVCRFANLKFNNYYFRGVYPSADYYCEGPLDHLRDASLNPLEKIQSDLASFYPERLFTCSLDQAQNSNCILQLTTPLYSIEIENQILKTNLEDQLESLTNQLYANSPSFYAGLNCNLINQESLIFYDQSQKYMHQAASCSF